MVPMSRRTDWTGALAPVLASIAALTLALTAGSGTAAAQEPAAPAPTADTAGATAEPAAPPIQWRAVADLVAAVHRSHVADPGPVLRFDDGGVYKYMGFHRREPWRDRARTRQQGWSTLVRGTSASVRFPAEASVCRTGCLLSVSVFSTSHGNRLTPVLNGKRLATKDIGDRWAVARFEVPPGGIVDGENVLKVRFSSAVRFMGDRHSAGLRFVRILPKDDTSTVPKLPPRQKSLRISETETYDVLWRAARTSWYVALPEKAQLRVAVAANAKSRAKFAVSAVDAVTGTRHKLLASVAAPQGARTEYLVDLAPVAGKPARLDLLWSGTGRAGVHEAAIVVPEAPGFAERPADAPPIAKNVVVYCIDTLRADHMQVYNPDTPMRLPHLDAFAEKSVTFLPGVTAGGHSLPSHASILLGKQPVSHKVYIGDDRIGGKEQLVSEMLQPHGIRTVLLSTNGYVSDKWGFKQGWSYYSNLLREKKGGTCEKLVEEVDTFLERNSGARFFMYLVPVEPHVPYRYREGLTDKYDVGGPYKGRYKRTVSGKDLGGIRAGRKVSARDRDRIRALYRGEVAHSDTCFGRLQKVLAKHGAADDTALVVMSDHGDELFDRGGVGHAHSVHQEVINVPFIVSVPGGRTVPALRREGAGHTDLVPTVLELMGVPLPERHRIQGSSLVPFLVDATPGMPGAHVANHGIVKRGMQLGDFKLITDWEGNEKLFDLSSDPTEQKDLLADRPHVLRLMRDVMSYWARDERRWRGPQWGNPAFPLPAYREWLDGGWQSRKFKPGDKKPAPKKKGH